MNPPLLDPSHRLFVAVALVWLFAEFGFGLIPARAGSPEARAADRGSWVGLTLGAVLGVGLSVVFRRRQVAMLPWAGAVTDIAGVAGVVAGWALRRWAMHTLGRSFTSRVAVEHGQQVVRDGPYRWIRHPAYLGNLVGFTAIGIGQGSWASLAVLLSLTVPAIAWRVRVEERALTERLGTPWLDYARSTARLVPGLW